MPKRPILAALFLAALAIPAVAGGWATVHLYVHKTGRCGTAREVLASFYGTGVVTANGERFNAYAVTAASYDYELGTTISVTNPHNGRTCAVRVNDRGPNGLARVMGARIDFALGARDCLGMVASQYVCAPPPHLVTAHLRVHKGHRTAHAKHKKLEYANAKQKHLHVRPHAKKQPKHPRPILAMMRPESVQAAEKSAQAGD